MPTDIEGFSVGEDGKPYITYKVGADSVTKKLGSGGYCESVACVCFHNGSTYTGVIARQIYDPDNIGDQHLLNMQNIRYQTGYYVDTVLKTGAEYITPLGVFTQSTTHSLGFGSPSLIAIAYMVE